MEKSFCEYRNKTSNGSDCDAEFIDNSLVEEKTYSLKKKNRTVFIAESEESTTDNENVEGNIQQPSSRAILKQSSAAAHHTKSSDDFHEKGSSGRQSNGNTIVLSSSDEGAVSPEILPKRPPPLRFKHNDSILGIKNKKRLMMLDSDTDNSIIKDNNRRKKLACLKDTPLKIDSGTKNKNAHISIEYSNNEETMSLADEKSDETEGNSETNDETSVSDESTDEDSANDCNDSENSNNDDKTVPIKKISRNKLKFSESENSDENNATTTENSNARYKSLSGSGKKKRGVKKVNVLESTDDESDNLRISIKNSKKNRKKVIRSDSSSDNDDHVARNEKTLIHRFTNHDYIGASGNIMGNQNDRVAASNSDNAQDDNKEAHVPAAIIRESSEVDVNDINSYEDTDDGPDEDLMVMSKATRMSIMGIVPKGDDSDESDFIESDSSHRKSLVTSNDEVENPESSIDNPNPVTPVKIPENFEKDGDTSQLTCTPFSSPLCDMTNVSLNGKKDEIVELNEDKPNVFRNKERSALITGKENDEVAIIESNPEIIMLSSDDDEMALEENKSPKMKKSLNIKKSPKPKAEVDGSGTIKKTTMNQYLLPPSYPNQIRYVTASERKKQLNKLEGLRADLANIQNLLEQMDLNTLPDNGKKLLDRVIVLEAEIRRQEDIVGNMVAVPKRASSIKKEEPVTTWDDLQKASNEVQPRMFGKQAMATHLAERNLILDSLRNLHESLASCPQESELDEQPRDVKTKLMGHQLHALAWLKWRETQRPIGGILADDMGLGKTITMISLIASDKENNIDHGSDDKYMGNKPGGGTLVVCPASLMQQWENEVKNHCARNALTVCLHHGAARAQRPHPLASYDVVVTTYNIMQRDHEKNGVLMRVNWRRVILDEAHIVRNHKSATSMGVSALNAKRRWCLTGTPVQNKDLDLFALLKFLKCTPFDELTMWKKWIDNKSLGGQERLNTVMRCILLRRTKQQLQAKGQLDCLPERTLHQEHVELTKAEMNVYQKVLVMSKTLFGQFLHQRAEKNADAVGFVQPGKNSEYTKMHKKMIALKGVKLVKSHEILVLLLRLRQVCCHCGLIGSALQEEGIQQMAPESGSNDLLDELKKLSLEDSKNKTMNPNKDMEDEEEEDEVEGASVADALKSVVLNNDPVFDMSKPSSKIRAVMDCLNKNVFKNRGDKAVVVSQWTGVLRLVEEQLTKVNVKSVTLSGSVSVPARQALINAINDPNSDSKVMLLSLSAGGVGLNLCGANHLLLLDPHWNPQLEEQAKDRIYRVGQKKHVHVYRFMCVDTVEQTIRKLQEVKLELAENVLTGAKNTTASKLTIEDLKMLFNMGG